MRRWPQDAQAAFEAVSYAYGKDGLALRLGPDAARKHKQLMDARRAFRDEREAEQVWRHARGELADAVPGYLAGDVSREDFVALAARVDALWAEGNS